MPNNGKWSKIAKLFAIFAITFAMLAAFGQPALAQDDPSTTVVEINQCGANELTGKNFATAEFNVVLPDDCSLITDSVMYNDCLNGGVVIGFDGPGTFHFNLMDGKARTTPTTNRERALGEAVQVFELNGWPLQVVIPGKGWEADIDGDGNTEPLPVKGPYNTPQEFVNACRTAGVELIWLSADPLCQYICDINRDGKIDEKSIPDATASVDTASGRDGGGFCAFYCPEVGNGDTIRNDTNGGDQGSAPKVTRNNDGTVTLTGGDPDTTPVMPRRNRVDTAGNGGSPHIPLAKGDWAFGETISLGDKNVCTSLCFVRGVPNGNYVVHGGLRNPTVAEWNAMIASDTYKEVDV